MYTLQALWTMARENLNVKTLVFANRGYQILKAELANITAGKPERKANGNTDHGQSRAGLGRPRQRPWCGSLAR